MSFSATPKIGICANYDRSPITDISSLTGDEMRALYRQKLQSIPLLNWSQEARIRFFKQMAKKKLLAQQAWAAAEQNKQQAAEAIDLTDSIAEEHR